MKGQILIWIKQRWRLLFSILVPLVLLPLPIVNNSSEAKCGYVVLLLSVYWISEAIPMPVTSLLPLVLFPLVGVLEARVVAQSYFKDITALLFGSLSLAYAIEFVNLHRRIALFVLSYVGTSTKWAMGGLMAVTAFLSMWINNSAATLIMLPVAQAISDELERYGKVYRDKEGAVDEATAAADERLKLNEVEVPNRRTTEEEIGDAFHIEDPKIELSIEVKDCFRFPWQRRPSFKVVKSHEKKHDAIRKGFLLATTYSATIGGLSTLVGGASNMFAKGFVESTYKGTTFHISFLDFFLFAFPAALLMLIFCWLWLQFYYNRKELFQCRTNPQIREVQANLKTMLAKQYNELEKPNWNEYCVSIVFFIMVILWMTREFGQTRGWGILFRDRYISDGTVAVFCSVLTLILPDSNPFKNNWKYEPIVPWNNLIKNISWSVLFLLGAGLSIALAFNTSGLSASVAQALQFLTGIPRVAVIFIIIVISGLFTEVTSNLSTVTIFLPVLDSVARSSNIHPGFLILPCTLAVCLAFMLPIATPPNAIVFSSGAIRVIDMIKTGVVMNIVGFLVILLAATTWMPKIYNLDDPAVTMFFSNNTTTLATTMAPRG